MPLENSSGLQANPNAPQNIFSKHITILFEALASRGAISLADQSISSATNFLTGVIIGRAVSKEQFGVFMLGYSIFLFLMNLQASLIFSPYMVYSPGLDGDKLKRYTGSSLIHQLSLAGLAMLFFGLCSLVIARGFGPKGMINTIWVLVAITTFILLREFGRQICFSQMRTSTALFIDASVAVIQLSGLMVLAFQGTLSINRAYWIMGCACGVPAVTWLAITRKQFKFSLRDTRSDFFSNWVFSKWLFAGSLAFIASSQLYPWFLAGFHGIAIAGVLAACSGIINFVNPFLLGMGNFIGPSAARALDNGGTKELRLFIFKSTLFLTVVIGLFCIVMLFAGDWMVSFIYGSAYGGNGVLIGILALSMFASAITWPLHYGLLVLQRSDVSFKCDLLALVVALSIGFWLVKTFGLIGVGCGLLLGHMVESIFRFYSFNKAIAERRHSETYKLTGNSTCADMAGDVSAADKSITGAFIVNQHNEVPMESLLRKVQSPEAPFLIDLFAELNCSGASYAVLRNYDGLPSTLNGSDLDICVAPENLKIAQDIIYKLVVKHNAIVSRMKKNDGLVSIACFGFADGIPWGVPIDLFTTLRWNGIEFYDLKKTLLNSFCSNGVWVAEAWDAAMITFLKEILHNGICLEKTLVTAIQAHDDKPEQANLQFFSTFGRQGRKLTEMFHSQDFLSINKLSQSLRRDLILRSLFQSPLQIFRNRLRNEINHLERLFKRPGIFAAVLGLDGSGKGTLINFAKQDIDSLLHCTTEYRHMRPGFLPALSMLTGRRRSSGEVVTDPHAKPPSKLIGSILRLIYYTVDYLVGYWVLVYPVLAKRRTVLFFDRYFYDFFVDPARCCIDLPWWIVRLFEWFIPRPDVIIMLRPEPEIFYGRKPEVPLEELRLQTARSYKLSATLKHVTWVNTACEVEISRRQMVAALFAGFDRRPSWEMADRFCTTARMSNSCTVEKSALTPIATDRQKDGALAVGRFQPWHFMLRGSPTSQILAVGLNHEEIERLRLFYRSIHLCQCEREIPCSTNQTQQSEALENALRSNYYDSIIIADSASTGFSPEVIYGSLKPGGVAVWFGNRRPMHSFEKEQYKSFPSVLEYLVLNLKNERALALINDKKSIKDGFDLYMPGKPHMQLGLRLVRSMIGLGLYRFLTAQYFIVARKSNNSTGEKYLLDWLSDRMRKRIDKGNMYIGKTKLVLQLIDTTGGIVGIAKVAGTPSDARAIERETKALRRLECVAGMKHLVPEILSTGEWQSHAVQVQTAMTREGTNIKTKLTPQHIEFLVALTRIDQCPTALENWSHWSAIQRWAFESNLISTRDAELVRTIVEQCRQSLCNVKIPFHRVHGDFVPWNIRWSPTGLVVFDWEESEAQGLPLCDAINFTMRVATSLKDRVFSLEQMLVERLFVQDIKNELNLLASSLSLTRHFGFKELQLEALIQLCIIRYLIEVQTDLSFADQ